MSAGRFVRAARLGASAIYLAGLSKSQIRFRRAIAEPKEAQRACFERVLRAAKASAYGRFHGLDRVSSIQEFQRQIPIVGDYEILRPWVDRIAAGEANVLTAERVRVLERTGGTTSANKLIPYTKTLLAEFSAATEPWIFSMYANRPRLIGTRAYWSLSPAAQVRKASAGGIPIGFESDTEYFGPWKRRFLDQLMSVPGAVARIPDIAAWRSATARYLLADADLGVISVWNPSFLRLLMEAIQAEWETLVRDLPTPRRRAIESTASSTQGLNGELIWPRLGLVSCWTHAHAESFLPGLRRFFPSVEIEGKGLLATEGVVSTPFGDGDPVLAIRSHFLEFADPSDLGAPPRLAHELERGQQYTPILSTSGGFLRYHLKDVVECTGFAGRTARVRFVGKMDGVSDLSGEKLSWTEVDEALARATSALGVELDFALVVPLLGEPPRYRLYVDASVDEAVLTALAAHVEARLAGGYHYRYARDLGQLGPLELRRSRGGLRRYEAELVARGARAGDIKPTHLDARLGWAAVLDD